MATRSRIGMVNKDGSITSIYCHWDGYPEYNGKILNEYYMDADKVNALMKLGDISSLAENLEPKDNEPHSFDNPVKGVVVAYGRDRGETGVEATASKDFDDFINCCNSCYVEYAYLFENGKWKEVYNC